MMIGSMIPSKKYQKISRTKNKFLVTFYFAELIILCKRKQTTNVKSKKAKQTEREEFNMKNLLPLLLVACIMLGLSACGTLV